MMYAECSKHAHYSTAWSVNWQPSPIISRVELKEVERQMEAILYCKQCDYRLNLPESIKRGVCLSCYEKEYGRTTPPLETLDFQPEAQTLAESNPLTSETKGEVMKLADFLKNHDNSSTSYTKIEKNSNTTLRILAPEPTCCLPVWFDNQDGKRRKLNSISIDSEGNQTGFECPILELNKENPHRTIVYGVYNFNTERVELFCISQLSILRGLNALEQSLNAKNKEITSYNLIISRADTAGKTTYNVSFAADHDLSQKDKQSINNAMDKTKPGNIFELMRFETRWPTQDDINSLGLKFTLPNLSKTPVLNEEVVPF